MLCLTKKHKHQKTPIYVKRDNPIKGKVLGVLDGDSLILELDNSTKIDVRVYGIDALELRQPLGLDSRNTLRSFVFEKYVTAYLQGKDRYGRTVAEIQTNEGNANVYMMEMGLARHYKAFSDDELYAQAEEYAKQNHLGMWKEAEPIAPWDYRSAEGLQKDDL